MSDDILVGEVAEQVLQYYPQYRLREKDPLVFHASESGKCGRAITYKKLKYPESNPADLYGQFRMAFGNYTESGLKYQFFTKTGVFGMSLMSAQGDCGEQDFYGTKWTGYRDFDFVAHQGDQRIPIIVELKTKVGFGAKCMIHKTPYSKKLKTPELDRAWGYPQQLALYLHDFYKHSKDSWQWLVDGNPLYGRLVYYLYFDGGCGFVEFFAKYQPENDSVLFYKVASHQFPDINGGIHEIVYLKDIADKWKTLGEHIAENKLAPPEYERKYDINDPKIDDATKSDLQGASKNQVLIGDMQCKYCSFRDQCAKDLGIELSYNKEELKVLKGKFNSR